MSSEVTAYDLKRSFDGLSRATVKPEHNSLELIRSFYAAECGLKAALMIRSKLSNTGQLGDLRSHDLLKLAKALRMRPADYHGVASCRREAAPKKPTITLTVAEMHEAWRYGAKVEAVDEKRFITGLRSIIEWCRKELNL